MPPPAQRPEQFHTIAGLTSLGLVVNPKTATPLLSMTDGDYVSIRSLSAQDALQRLGSGYLDSGRDDAASATDLPRSHTPDGVVIKNMGYGTALYTALCLGASLTAQGVARVSSHIEGEGISSDPENRSAEASAWWRAALARGLIQEHAFENDETEEDVHLNPSPRELNNCLDVDGEITYVNRVSVDIRRTTEGTYNFYTYDSARSHHLIAAEFVIAIPRNVPRGADIRYVWEALLRGYQSVKTWGPSGRQSTELDAEALLSLDVRGLDREAISLLAYLYTMAGLGDARVDALIYRWQHNLDPAAAPEQMRLPFQPNQAQAASLGAMLGEVAHARQRAGWNELADLP